MILSTSSKFPIASDKAARADDHQSKNNFSHWSTIFIIYSKCIHLLEWFDFRNHICMVFELLGQSVFDFLKENEFHPFPAHHIQHFARQLLTSVACKFKNMQQELLIGYRCG
jgi:hypothetical protein